MSTYQPVNDADSDVDDEELNDLSIPLRSPRAGQPVADGSSYASQRPSLDEAATGRDDAESLLAGSASPSAQPQRAKRPRAPSFSRFSFEFAGRLAIPLSVDIEPGGQQERNLGVFSGMALVIGAMIGSGIFSSPGVVVSDVGSVGAALLVWLGAILLSWTGAATFAELGAAIPLNGGMQAYLNYTFGPLCSYLFSFSAIAATKPGSSAAIALICSEYICRILYHTAYTADSAASAKAIPTAVLKVVALFFIALAGLLMALSNRLLTRTQGVLTSTKILSLLAVAIIGIVQAARGRAAESMRHNIFAETSSSPGAYALALYSALWATSAWDTVNYAAAEMTNPGRDLPRVVHFSVGTILVVYIAANVSYFVVLEKPLVAHSNTVALDFGKATLGAAGGVVFAFLVMLSAFGALTSGMFASSRLIAVAGQDGHLPKRIGELHTTRKTPVNAIVFHCLISSLYALVGNFKSLIILNGICEWFFYVLTTISLFLLRAREPDLERPYRTFLGWPLLFSMAGCFILLMPVVAAPIEALLAVAVIASGVPAYYLTRRRNKLSFETLYKALPSFGASRGRHMSGGLHASQATPLPRVSEADEEDDVPMLEHPRR